MYTVATLRYAAAMQRMRQYWHHPAIHLCYISVLLFVAMAGSNMHPLDDHFHYQRFIETLASGRIDLSIPGFHGTSFISLPLYLLTHSPLTNLWMQMLWGLSLPALGYGAARYITDNRNQALLFAYAVGLMPFLTFIGLRGFTFPTYTGLLFLTIIGHGRGARWTWLPFGLALITKPFIIALSPLLLFWPGINHSTPRHRWIQWGLGIGIGVLYVLAQISQVGRVIVGAHMDIDAGNVFVWWRAPLNWIHGFQMLFSVHNFYFPDPARTAQGNLVHGSPILLLLGTLYLLAPKHWKQNRLDALLGLSAAFAFILAGLLDHMDHFYLETCVILLSLAGIKSLRDWPQAFPLILGSYYFQFFYIYLQYRGEFFNGPALFVLPAGITLAAVAAVIQRYLAATKS